MKFIPVLLFVVLTITQAQATPREIGDNIRLGNPNPTPGPSGTAYGAINAVKRYRYHRFKFKYYKNWTQAMPAMKDLDNVLEGMSLNVDQDFMKDYQPMIVIGIDKKRVEVIYPVMSVKNGRHVLRGAIVPRSKVGF